MERFADRSRHRRGIYTLPVLYNPKTGKRNKNGDKQGLLGEGWDKGRCPKTECSLKYSNKTPNGNNNKKPDNAIYYKISTLFSFSAVISAIYIFNNTNNKNDNCCGN